MKNAVHRVDGDIKSFKNEIKEITENTARYMVGEVYGWREQVSDLIKKFEAELKRIEGKINQINGMLEGYNEMVKTYHEEDRKLETLNLQIEEVTRLEEEYRRKLESLSQASLEISILPELTHEKAMLTQADGLASRRKGDLAQKETAKLLRRLGFEVDDHYGVGLPDYIFWKAGKKVAIGAHKAFTLSKEETKQRTITAEMMKAEINAAMKYKLPLVILVTNLRNKRRWVELIPYEELKEFKRFTTPLILAEDAPESQKICEESILRLREILGYILNQKSHKSKNCIKTHKNAP